MVNANGTAINFYYKHDGTNLYIASQCNVTNMCELVFDLNHDAGSAPQTDDILFHASAATYEKPGTGTGWSSTQTSPSGWSANTGFGFVREWSISLNKLGIIPGNDQTIGAGFRVMMSGKTGFWPLGGDKDKPGTWGDLTSSDNWGGGPSNKLPKLSGGLVSPLSGLTTDNFTFNVTYKDLDDDEPTLMKIYIDGTGYDMSTTDTTYDDGSNYIFDTKLSAGGHKFYFMSNDSKVSVRLPISGDFDGPEVIEPNTPPAMIPGGIPNSTFEIDEDSGSGDDLIDLEDYFNDDRDDGNLSFEIIFEEDNAKLDASVDGRYLDFTQVVEDWFGMLEFKVKATDRGYDGLVGVDVDLERLSNPFTVAVNPVDDPAVLTDIGPKVVGLSGEVELTGSGGATEDQWFNFTITATDADLEMGATDSLVFGTNSSQISIENDAGNELLAHASMIPGNEDVGFVYASITVKDSTGSEIDDIVNLTIEVSNTNDDPEIVHAMDNDEKVQISEKTIEFTGSYSAIENEWFNITVVAEDADINIGIDDKLYFGINVSLDNLELDPLTGELSYLPIQQDVGIHFVRVTVMDDFDQVTDDYLDLVIEVANVNDRPTKPSITSESGSYTFKEGRYVNISSSSVDQDIGYDDNEKLSYDWNSDVDGKIGNTNSLSTNSMTAGLHNITLTVTDNYGKNAETLFQVTIIAEVVIDDKGPDDDKNKEDKVAEDKSGGTNYLWLIIVVMIVVISLVLFFVLTKKKKKSEPTDTLPPLSPVLEPFPNGQNSDLYAAPQQLAPPQQQDVQQLAYTDQPQVPPAAEAGMMAQPAELQQTLPAPEPQQLALSDQGAVNPVPPQNVGAEQQQPYQQQIDTPAQTYTCQTCGQPLTYVTQSNNYFCNQCQQYV
jgi:hypothetical protein